MRLTLGLHRLLVRTAPFVVALGITAAVAPSAEAGSYHVWGCRTPSGELIDAPGWQVTVGNGLSNDCKAGGGVTVRGGDVNGNEAVGAAWYPGAGLWATRGVVWRSTTATATGVQGSLTLAGHVDEPDSPTYWQDVALDALNSTGSKGDAANPLSAANRVDFGSWSRIQANDTTATFGGRCNYWPSPSGTSCFYQYTIHAYDFVVDDRSAPTITKLAGTLVDGAGALTASAPLSGTRAVAVHGTDVGSGVFRAILQVDGREVVSGAVSGAGAEACVAEAAGDGGRAFRTARPCPLSASPSLAWDTTTVADGLHDVRVLLEDASGNRSTAVSGKVQVRQPTPTPTLTAAPGGTVGAAEQPVVGPGSPLEARGAENGGAAGGGLPDAGKLELGWPAKRKVKKPAQQLTAAYSPKGTRTLSGRLTTPSGAAIAGAQLRVTERGAWTGAPSTTATPAVTSADGTFSFRAALAGGSRTILVQWFSHASDTLPAAIAQVTLTVGAATSLDAPSHVRRGASARFTGTLRGTAGLVRAVPISIQALDHGTWKTVAAATTGTRGKWAASVTFPSRIGRWKFRARIGLSSTYPYAPGVASSTVTVRTG